MFLLAAGHGGSRPPSLVLVSWPIAPSSLPPNAATKHGFFERSTEAFLYQNPARSLKQQAPLRIASICGIAAASVLLSTAFLFDGTVKQLLLIIGLITSLAFALLIYLILR